MVDVLLSSSLEQDINQAFCLLSPELLLLHDSHFVLLREPCNIIDELDQPASVCKVMLRLHFFGESVCPKMGYAASHLVSGILCK